MNRRGFIKGTAAAVLAIGVTDTKRPARLSEGRTSLMTAFGTIYTSLPIRVNNPRKLGTWQLPAERVVLGEAYKPSMALLPNGELVLVALFGDQVGDGKI